MKSDKAQYWYYYLTLLDAPVRVKSYGRMHRLTSRVEFVCEWFNGSVWSAKARVRWSDINKLIPLGRVLIPAPRKEAVVSNYDSRVE